MFKTNFGDVNKSEKMVLRSLSEIIKNLWRTNFYLRLYKGKPKLVTRLLNLPGKLPGPWMHLAMLHMSADIHPRNALFYFCGMLHKSDQECLMHFF